MVRSALRGLPTTLPVSGGYERGLAPLLFVLLFGWTIGGTFVDVLVPLYLAFEAVKNHPDRLFTRGVVGGDVEELLGGSQALTS